MTKIHGRYIKRIGEHELTVMAAAACAGDFTFIDPQGLRLVWLWRFRTALPMAFWRPGVSDALAKSVR